jgi:hypothetical protein
MVFWLRRVWLCGVRKGHRRQQAFHGGNKQEELSFLEVLGKLFGMSALELVEQVNRLPEAERRKFLRKLQKSKPPTTSKAEVKWPDVKKRAEELFGERLFPNFVLMARDEEPF